MGDNQDLSARARDTVVSVVVATRLGAGWLPRCLSSLAEQDLVEGFEVVVVHDGPDDGTRAVIDELHNQHPGVLLRYVRGPGTTRAAAKNRGLAESVGSYVVFVHDEDRVSGQFLSGLLSSRPQDEGVVLPLRLGDPGDGPAPMHGVSVQRHFALAGQVVAARRVATALAPVVGLALPRTLLARQSFDPDLETGEDEVLLGRLLATTSITCAVTSAASGSVYYRAVRRNPGLPRVAADRLLDAVERVTALTLPADLEPLRKQLVDSAVREVNRYLQTHTDDHAAVIRQRREAGLEAVVELRRLNDRVARDLAILYTAVPYVDTSANVAARRVLARRRVVDVVSNDMSSRLAKDAPSQAIWAEFTDRLVELDARPSDIWWPGVAEFCHKGLAQITALERSKGPYRSVYSRAMHPTSHFLAAWFKLRRPEVTWYAELSDPMRHTVQGEERPSSGALDPVMMTDFRAGLSHRGFRPPESDNLFTWVETITYALADQITFTNENQRGFMLDRFPDEQLRDRASSHSGVSHHPVPEPWLYQTTTSSYQLPTDKVNLAYFGVFYATRGLTEVWQALSRLPRRARRSLVLHVFTNDPDTLRTQVAEAGLADVVVANPYVSYLEYLNLASRVDVLLVNDARTVGIHDCNPYLPSKWSDYRGSGTAVWGIVEPGSVLSRQPLQHRSELGDVAGALKVLGELITGAGSQGARGADTA